MSRHRTFVLAENGEKLQVIRPKNPERAIALAKAAVDNNDAALFEALPSIVQDADGDYTFMGYLARRDTGQPVIVDEDGKFLAEVLAGDSFVTGVTEADKQ